MTKRANRSISVGRPGAGGPRLVYFSPAAQPQTRPRATDDFDRWLHAKLRELYGSGLDEPLPPAMCALLKQMVERG